MSYDKKKKFIIDIIFYGIIAAMVFLTAKYAVSWILPFIIAFAVSAVIQPFSAKVSADFSVNRRFAACFSAFLFYGFAIGIIALSGFGIYGALKKLFYNLPFIYEESIVPALVEITVSAEKLLAGIDPSLSTAVQDFTQSFAENFGSTVSEISVGAIGWLSSYITKIPYFVAAVFISVIATFFISADYDRIKAFIVKQIPEKWHLFLADVREYGVKTLGRYFKSYALIMFITFCELCLALWLLGVKNFAVIAAVTAVFDIIPVCGSGGVLIPWAVFPLVQGRYAFGIGMLVVYAIITVVRQIIEPKIVGDQIGLPPVVTLMAMFVGVRIIGVLGLFIFPVILVILKSLNDNGKIKLFK